MRETWSIRKAPVASENGVVVSQHYRASEIGAEVLRDGGNAIDAAIATSFAIGVVEPWQSGLGSIGHLTFLQAGAGEATFIDFGARTPVKLEPSNYELTGAPGQSIFGWPAVRDDNNLRGPHSFGVPGQVAGMWQAHRRFGSLPWERLVRPAFELAAAGVPVDWYTTLKITAAYVDLGRNEPAASIFLPGGVIPAGSWTGASEMLAMPGMAATLERISTAGGDDFYRGILAETIAGDCAEIGSALGREDLEGYEAECTTVGAFRYGDCEIFAPPGLTAGPSLLNAFRILGEESVAGLGEAEFFSRIAKALKQTYRDRLRDNGAGDTAQRSSCTTHISITDRWGNAVALSQTLLDIFGSRVVLRKSGFLMNNALMWFDPVPGRPNSIGAGKRALSNMCPTIIRSPEGDVAAIGASGGRRILPAVLQLALLMFGRKLPLDEAVHHPRIDVSGAELIVADERLPASVIEMLKEAGPVKTQPSGVYPNYFACPNVALFQPAADSSTGAAFVPSPWAHAAGA